MLHSVEGSRHEEYEYALPTNDNSPCAMPHLSVVFRDTEISYELLSRTKKERVARTTASVMVRHMPEPPPVQKRTWPLKISALKMAVESATFVGHGWVLEDIGKDRLSSS